MTKPKSLSDEQLYALIRESHPPAESLPPAAAERMLSEIIASDRNETEQSRQWRAKRRRRIARTGALSVGTVLVLSGSALAAGNALGVINLGGGDTAEAVSTVETPYSSNGKIYDVTAKPGAAYAYRLVGGKPLTMAGESKAAAAECGPDPVNHILVESTRPLSTEELREILRDESAEHHVRTDTLPPGVVSIGVSCLDHPGLPAASPSTQAEAEAEGWTAEKFWSAPRVGVDR